MPLAPNCDKCWVASEPRIESTELGKYKMSGNDFNIDHPLSHRNVFVMMRFDETPQHARILEAIRESLNYYGFYGLRADDKVYADDKWENVRLYMEHCAYGIAVFDKTYEEDFNPNVSLELGYMLGQSKKCLVLKEQQLPELMSDLSGRLYRAFSIHDIEQTVSEQIGQWMRDLHVLPNEHEKLLIFVSTAGIDRCAMAKTILKWLLDDRKLAKPAFRIRIESAGIGHPYRPKSGDLGCEAIRALCGEDLLSSHRTQRLSEMLKAEADLILVMAEWIRESLVSSDPSLEEKTHNFKPFFGLEGDVDDPAIEPSPKHYRDVAEELKSILEEPNNLGKLIAALESSPVAPA
jgi:protein-tyrosine-phosphatase